LSVLLSSVFWQWLGKNLLNGHNNNKSWVRTKMTANIVSYLRIKKTLKNFWLSGEGCVASWDHFLTATEGLPQPLNLPYPQYTVHT
jgi:hypothetical protein